MRKPIPLTLRWKYALAVDVECDILRSPSYKDHKADHSAEYELRILQEYLS